MTTKNSFKLQKIVSYILRTVDRSNDEHMNDLIRLLVGPYFHSVKELDQIILELIDNFEYPDEVKEP